MMVFESGSASSMWPLSYHAAKALRSLEASSLLSLDKICPSILPYAISSEPFTADGNGRVIRNLLHFP